jgi:DNA-binding response OmpR family regulator
MGKVKMTKVLVIEDNEDVREEIVAILDFEGYEVRDAENGRRGLELVREWAPDLVICDLMMPELDGYATLEAVRADPASAATPFLCLTARGERRDMRRAMELGADDYLTKPFTAGELLAALNAALAKRASRPGGAGA